MRAFAATFLPAGLPLQPITLGFFNNLYHELRRIRDLQAPTSLRIAKHAVDLLAIALADVIENRPAPSPYRAALLRRIKDFIEAELHEPRLGVRAVAAKYRITPRYVAMLFREDGITFSDFVRQRRLERCRRQLEGLGPERRPIGEVALAAGFASQAHFSRLFRATYQTTPRQYRSAFDMRPCRRRPRKLGRRSRKPSSAEIAYARLIERPPSTSEAVPVTKDWHRRRRGYKDRRGRVLPDGLRASGRGGSSRNVCSASVLFFSRYIGVSTAPGSTAFTRHVLRAVFGGKRLGEADEARFAGGIGRHAGERPRIADEGRGKEDRPAAALFHSRDLVFGGEEGAGEIDGDGTG